MTGRFHQEGNLLRSGPVITQGMLDDLLGLNLAYLDLLTAHTGRPGEVEAHGLPQDDVMRLAGLTEAQRREVAACPYSLFRLNLPLDGVCAEPLFAPPLALAQHRHVCAVSALLFAWHLARSGQPAARVLLGLSVAACEYLCSLTASRLPAIATRDNLLITRFAQREHFWSELIQSVTAGYAKRLEVTHLAGAQWLAFRSF